MGRISTWCADMPTETITVYFVCGCKVIWSGTTDEPPVCEAHQERRVRAVQAPQPRFVMREA